MTELAIRAKLAALHLNNTTPAYKIVTRVGHGLWLPATQAAVAEELCRNVYWYGLNGAPAWVWDAGAGGNGTGEPLARGTISTTNCGGFNLTARWIGHNVLDLDPLLFTGSYTLANDYFVTQAGTVGIDRAWPGNVRTLTQDFAQVSAYFFMGHSYCKYGANMLDASTNSMNFQHKTDLYWCGLDKVFADMVKGRAFRVPLRRGVPVLPGANPFAVVSSTCLDAFKHMFPIVVVGGGQAVTQGFIGAMPKRNGSNWETMLLVSQAHLPPAFIAAVGL
jgi:hypothetical protein